MVISMKTIYSNVLYTVHFACKYRFEKVPTKLYKLKEMHKTKWYKITTNEVQTAKI